MGSDVHESGPAEADGLDLLRRAVAGARHADLLLLAGDTFDNNRLPVALLEAAAELLAEAGLRVVVLPGNHDPLTPDSVYYRGPFVKASNVCVLGLSVEESLVFPEWGLEVWGRAHRDYSDMTPLRDPPPRTTRWRIAVAHGHFDDDPPALAAWWPSWRIRTDQLAAVDADYIALGHWNRAASAGDGSVLASYSGSPGFTGTVNVVRLASDGSVQVTQEPL